MSDEDTLRRHARDAIRAGKLPDRRPTRMWGGPGVGARCTICNQPIGRNEMEFELQFPWNDDSDNHHVHPRCFAAWELERVEGDAATDGSVLPGSDTGGMMLSSGRKPQNGRGPA